MPDAAITLRSTVAELQRRTSQQGLIASFGRYALQGNDIGHLMHEAARLAAIGLGASLAKVLEHDAAEAVLIMRAGVGWRSGVVGHARLPMDASSPAAFCFASGSSTVCNDIANDLRFGLPPLLAGHGARREVNVLIRGDGAPFGVLEVDDTEDGTFSTDDVSFLEALANTLGLAIERARFAVEREAIVVQRGLLLAEVHHRVKNSLQLVHTVLSLQAREAEDDAARALLEQSAVRVLTIGAVHEQLYRGGDFAEVEMRDYLIGLVTSLQASLAELAPGRAVRLEADHGIQWPPRRAQAFGLVLAELVTNAFKYGGQNVEVRFVAAPVEAAQLADARPLVNGNAILASATIPAWPTRLGGARLEVRDDGAGLPAGFDLTQNPGLGMRIVAALLRQEGASLAFGGESQGTWFVADFPAPLRLTD